MKTKNVIKFICTRRKKVNKDITFMFVYGESALLHSIKKPNWQEANRLAFHSYDRGFEFMTTEKLGRRGGGGGGGARTQGRRIARSLGHAESLEISLEVSGSYISNSTITLRVKRL